MPANRNWRSKLSRVSKPVVPVTTPPAEKASVAAVAAVQSAVSAAQTAADTAQATANALGARPDAAEALTSENEIDVYQEGVRKKTTLGDLKSFINGG